MTTKLRACIVFAVLVVSTAVFAPCLWNSRQAHALEPPAPSRLSREDTLSLELYIIKIQRFYDLAQPLIDKRDAIYAKYKINPAEVGKTVGFNLDTGEITRAPVQTPPKK